MSWSSLLLTAIEQAAYQCPVVLHRIGQMSVGKAEACELLVNIQRLKPPGYCRSTDMLFLAPIAEVH